MKRRAKFVVGALVMSGMILISLPLGVTCSLNCLRENIMEDCYYHDSTGFAITQGLKREVQNAREMADLAQNYVEYAPKLQHYIDMLDYQADLCETSCEPGTPEEAEAYGLLVCAAQTLHEQLQWIELKKTDENYSQWQDAWQEDQEIFDWYLQMVDFTQQNLQSSNYNHDAQQFNEQMEQLPVKLLREFSGIGKMGVFGETAEKDENSCQNAFGKYKSMQAYVESPFNRIREKDLNNSLVPEHISLKIVAEGDTLVYVYTYESLQIDEITPSALDTIIAGDESAETEADFTAFAEYIASTVEGADGIVRIRDLDKDGRVIFSKDFKAQE